MLCHIIDYFFVLITTEQCIYMDPTMFTNNNIVLRLLLLSENLNLKASLKLNLILIECQDIKTQMSSMNTIKLGLQSKVYLYNKLSFEGHKNLDIYFI